MSDTLLVSQVTLREMCERDLDAAVALSLRLGWPHRIEDWRFLLVLGGGAVAVGPGDEVIGTIIWCPFGTTHAALSLIIVREEWRGHGIGKRLVQCARKALLGRRLSLSATAVGVPLYRKMGFAPCDIIEQRQANAVTQPVVALLEGSRLRPVCAADEAICTQMDLEANGVLRSDMIRRLIKEESGIIHDSPSGPLGFSFCRKFGWGEVVGPVLAADSLSARAMIAYWVGSRAGHFVRIDTPLSCGLSGWLDEIGLMKVDTVTEMSTFPVSRRVSDAFTTFALCSQALG